MTSEPAPGAALTADERSELEWLRTENTLLRVERDILLRVAVGYAEDMAADHVVPRDRQGVEEP